MIRDWLRTLIAELPGDSASLDAQVLLAHVTGQKRAWVLTHLEVELEAAQAQMLREALERLKGGEPLPYVLGHWEFFGLDFVVTPDVLIPRPETELLVETVLGWIKKQGDHQSRPDGIIDVGTGSGIIPVTLATQLPTAQFLATDISPAALAIARRNAERQHVAERIEFVECNLLPEVEILTRHASRINILTANLPYIPTETMKGLPIYGREPTLALDGGADGLEVIRRLLARLTATRLKVDLILLEIENRQGAAAKALAREKFPDADIQIIKDLAGHDRLVAVET